MNGRLSKARIRRVRRRGISDRAKEAEERRDCSVRGFPKERSVERVIRLGACTESAKFDRSCATSGVAGFGVRRVGVWIRRVCAGSRRHTSADSDAFAMADVMSDGEGVYIDEDLRGRGRHRVVYCESDRRDGRFDSNVIQPHCQCHGSSPDRRRVLSANAQGSAGHGPLQGALSRPHNAWEDDAMFRCSSQCSRLF